MTRWSNLACTSFGWKRSARVPSNPPKRVWMKFEDCELFVGIYAHRYGYIPAGASISITEQEFDHAQKLGKPIFGFIINEDHPWSPKHIEHDKKDKLDALLSKVKRQPVEFFTTPDNLANNIASSVGHYLSRTNSPIPINNLKVVNRKSPQATPSPPNPTSSVVPKNSKSSNPPSPPTPAPGAH